MANTKRRVFCAVKDEPGKKCAWPDCTCEADDADAVLAGAAAEMGCEDYYAITGDLPGNK